MEKKKKKKRKQTEERNSRGFHLPVQDGAIKTGDSGLPFARHQVISFGWAADGAIQQVLSHLRTCTSLGIIFTLKRISNDHRTSRRACDSFRSRIFQPSANSPYAELSRFPGIS